MTSSSSSSSSSSSLLCVASEESLSALSTSLWRFESWLAAFPLSAATVLDYFKHSPFYSFSCNNERAAGSLQQLRHMEGVEFEVDQPPASADAAKAAASSSSSSSYFLIRRQWRLSPSAVHLLQLFMVVGVEPSGGSASSLPRGSVVPLPSFSAVAQCAVNAALTTLNHAIQLALSTAHTTRSTALEGEEGRGGQRAVLKEEGGDEEQAEQWEEEEQGALVAEQRLGGAGGTLGRSTRTAASTTAAALPRPLLQLADDALRRALQPSITLHQQQHSAAQVDAAAAAAAESGRGR